MSLPEKHSYHCDPCAKSLEEKVANLEKTVKNFQHERDKVVVTLRACGNFCCGLKAVIEKY